MSERKLTPRELEVLGKIRIFLDAQGRPPTSHELCVRLGISRDQAARYLKVWREVKESPVPNPPADPELFGVSLLYQKMKDCRERLEFHTVAIQRLSQMAKYHHKEIEDLRWQIESLEKDTDSI